MRKEPWAIFTLLAFAAFVGACATISPEYSVSGSKPLQGRVEARQFPELQLITIKGDTYNGKLIALEDDQVLLRPLPYWNVDPIRILIEDIFVIQFDKKASSVGNGFLDGFGWTFITIGIIAAVSSKYDVDYKNSLAASAVYGLIGGLLGLAVKAIVNSGKTSRFEFSKLSPPQKMGALRTIMGF